MGRQVIVASLGGVAILEQTGHQVIAASLDGRDIAGLVDGLEQMGHQVIVASLGGVAIQE